MMLASSSMVTWKARATTVWRWLTFGAAATMTAGTV
ncbi:DUF2537 domain-containing protein [Segatella copri]|uniref:DUF2537 domain-containing protein n=1 Tax=Segatella copri TaxID=165179 RepID=A0A3E5EB72_9BACT|nr:DUF2537 domain-containing protein [Segatella copri]RGS18375.1 DUF2537 domain-containing protein [Segatella copri]RHK12513.1 DUF2537 domain-containing protein [Segatella copri]